MVIIVQHRIIRSWYSILAVDGWAVTFGTAMRGLGGAAARPCRLHLAVPNVTAYPSPASVPITILLYNFAAR